MWINMDTEQLGYDCGYTYIIGGRPPLSPEQQVIFAGWVSTGCCHSLQEQQKFVAAFQRGYSRRFQEIQEREEDYATS